MRFKQCNDETVIYSLDGLTATPQGGHDFKIEKSMDSEKIYPLRALFPK